jgi:hypothetical protein
MLGRVLVGIGLLPGMSAMFLLAKKPPCIVMYNKIRFLPFSEGRRTRASLYGSRTAPDTPCIPKKPCRTFFTPPFDFVDFCDDLVEEEVDGFGEFKRGAEPPSGWGETAARSNECIILP